MPTALHIAGLPSQSRQGVGARLVRRIGGAVRSAIGSGINLAGALRRPAVSQTSQDHAAAKQPQAPAPSRMRVSRRPSPARPLPFLLPRWLAPLLARRQHHPTAPSRRNHADILFTPEAFPQLSLKACAVLNTPVKDCDPKTLHLVLSTFARYVNQVMSPEAGITNPAATLPNLWHRLSTALSDTNADTTLPATPEPVPAAPADTLPDAPASSTQPQVHAPPTGPIMPSAKDAPHVSPVPPSSPPASDQPADPAITAAAPQTTPDIAARSAPVGPGSRPLSTPGQSFRYRTQSFARRRLHHARCRPALFPPGARDRLQCVPPPWKLHYAACAGPPGGIAWRMSEAMNGAAARQSRRPDSRQTNLAEPYRQARAAVA